MTLSSWSYFSEVFMGVDVTLNNSQPVRGRFYRGSQFFHPLASFMRVPLDQINYVICGVVSFALTQLMRHHLQPRRTSVRVRALAETVFGIILLSFCFGNQLRVLLLQSAVSYMLMICLPHNRFMAILVTVWSLFYMTLVHLCRLQYDYGGYTLDISGPVMVQTQRLSSLAFNLVDGALLNQNYESKKHDPIITTNDVCYLAAGDVKINNNGTVHRNSINTIDNYSIKSQHFKQLQIKANVRKRSMSNTNLIQLIGSDEQKFPNKNKLLNHHHHHNNNNYKSADNISGTNLQSTNPRLPPSHVKHAVKSIPNPIEFFAYTLNFHGSFVGPFIFFSEYDDYLKGYKNNELPPVDIRYAIILFVRTLTSGLSSAYLAPYFAFEYVITDSFIALPLYKRLVYSTISLFLVRQKYYFAWGLSELNGLAIGAGYTGRCPLTGRVLNHNVRNFDFVQVECGLTLKNVVDAWNISTTRWLREVFYDRLDASYRTVLVFIISAFWHGFYPGYYLMFLSFALFTIASRIWRRNFRQYFHQTAMSVRLYNIFTVVLTNFIINYGQAPFHLLDLNTSIKFLKSFYFLPHIIALIIIISHSILSRIDKSMQTRRQKSTLNIDRSVGG